ncbi:MAG TPA: glycosyltransferase [Pyrinomonadaceae bacterium]|nr:glycosyltransferase [Pyrinomonadaceae bacterium]
MTSQQTPSTLYLCYFGLREPLVQTQVLPYLRELAAGGARVTLLTFEPSLEQSWTAEALREASERLAREGVRWERLAYHKRPSVPATLYDIAAGALFAAREAQGGRAEVLHARAHVPMAMAMAARKLARGVRVVFDIRGLMADEYADAGVWREGSLPFRLVKALERAGARRADQIVVLTRRMRDYLVAERLAPADKIEVIPCCVDFSRYDGDAASRETGAAGGDAHGRRFEVVYAGSAVGLYLVEEMGRFFAEVRAREPRAFFRVLTKSPAGEVAAKLRGVGLAAEDFWVGPARADEVPGHLARARVGVSFRKPTFSQIAASPTKIPEYLAAGLPVVSNTGIGDTDELVERERIGVLVPDFTKETLSASAARVLALAAEPDVAERCRAAARAHFDLKSVGGEAYRRVYRRLAATLPASR